MVKIFDWNGLQPILVEVCKELATEAKIDGEVVCKGFIDIQLQEVCHIHNLLDKSWKLEYNYSIRYIKMYHYDTHLNHTLKVLQLLIRVHAPYARNALIANFDYYIQLKFKHK